MRLRLKVTMTMNFSKSFANDIVQDGVSYVSGRRIIDAVKKLTGDDFIDCPYIIDDHVCHRVGRQDLFVYGNFIIAVGDRHSSFEISPGGKYNNIAVVYYPWEEVGIEDELEEKTVKETVRFIRAFRDELEKELKVKVEKTIKEES